MHVFTCPVIRAQEDRKTALSTFIDWMTSAKTSPFIMCTIVDTLKLHAAASFRSQCPAMSHPYIVDAAEEQDSIGFLNFLSGRVSTKWSEAQQAYLNLAYPESKSTGRSWAAGLVRNICSYTKLLWVKRSAAIHEDDSTKWRRKTDTDLGRNIQALYAQGVNSVACEERFLFDIDLCDLLALPITAKQQWIDAIIAAQEFFEVRTQSELEIMQRFMERWRTRRR